MKNIKKGFTLIEVVISISLISIICIAGFKQLVYISKFYNKECRFAKDEFYVNEGMNFIESTINKSDKIEIIDRKEIKMYTKDKDHIENIENEYTENSAKVRNGKLILVYHKYEGNFHNNILLNVKEMILDKVENVLYVTLITKKGEEYIKCIAIPKTKDLSLCMLFL